MGPVYRDSPGRARIMRIGKERTMLNRRQFLQGTLAAGAASWAMTAGAQASAATNGERPNVLFIISDDQAWGDYSFMGHPYIDTPRIDRLARESLCYTRGYVSAPLCCPALASMVTGLHPHQNGITCNDPTAVSDNPWEWTPERFEMREEIISAIDHLPSLPRMLGEAGYQSMQTGKWWLGDYARGGFTHGMTHGDPERGGRHGDEGLKIGREGLDPIADFLDEAASDPFFIWYAPFMPHDPHTPPERLLQKYLGYIDNEPVARFWAMCEWFDETCGDLLDMLEERGVADNTVVVYACDNGWIQNPLIRDRFAPRSKQTHYEGGIRTPIMVRWPGRIEPRMDVTTPVSIVDMVPTALAACGIDTTPEMPGLDLGDHERAVARGGVCGGRYAHTARDNHDPLANLDALWVVQGDWKLATPAGPQTTVDSEVELFHVVSDPHELNNLAAGYPEKVDELMAELADWWSEGAATAKAAGNG